MHHEWQYDGLILQVLGGRWEYLNAFLVQVSMFGHHRRELKLLACLL